MSTSMCERVLVVASRKTLDQPRRTRLRNLHMAISGLFAYCRPGQVRAPRATANFVEISAFCPPGPRRNPATFDKTFESLAHPKVPYCRYR